MAFCFLMLLEVEAHASHNVILFSSMPTPLNVGMKLKVKTIPGYCNNRCVFIKLTHCEKVHGYVALD